MGKEQWVVADAFTAGIVRFGSMIAGLDRPLAISTMPSSKHSTFTDALLAYEREAGIVLGATPSSCASHVTMRLS